MALTGITHRTPPVIILTIGHLWEASESLKGEEPSFPFQGPSSGRRVLLEDLKHVFKSVAPRSKNSTE